MFKLVCVLLSVVAVQCHLGGYGMTDYDINNHINDHIDSFEPNSWIGFNTFDIGIPSIPDILDDIADTADVVTGELEKIKNCLPPVEEGLVVTPFKRSYDNGENISLSCMEGYELRYGLSNTSTCRGYAFLNDHGTFMPSVGPNTCIKTPRCRALIQEGLVVEPFKMYYELGEKIAISCMEGYTLATDEELTCTRDKNDYYGQMMYYTFSGGANFLWNGMHACRKIKDCPLPIHSGLIVEPFQPSYKKGDEITLSCEEGYSLTISNKSTCDETGSFDMDLDSDLIGYGVQLGTKPCKKEVTCRPPFLPGIVVTPSKSLYLKGETITISCKTNYELTSPVKATCKESNAGYFEILDTNPLGVFQPSIVFNTCKRLPRCFSPLRRGMTISPAKTYYELGETITLSCDDGYELTSDVTTRTCTKNGVMNYHRIASAGFKPEIETTICRKKPSCKPPIQLGLVLSPKKRAYDVGEIVEISCAEGYELKKTNQSLCKAASTLMGFGDPVGEFSPQIDEKVCEKIRSCSPPIRKGLIMKPKKGFYRIGEKISLSCEEGYELRVAPMSTCRASGSFFSRLSKEGKFDPEITWDACRKPTACELPIEDNLIVTPLKEVYHEGEEIALSCGEGYTLISPKTMMCERAAFCRGKEGVTGCFFPGVTRGICKEKPKCNAPARQKGLVLTPTKETYYEGEEIALSCKDGYELRGPATTKCKANNIKISNYNMFLSLSIRSGKNTFSPSIMNACKKVLDPPNKETEEDEEEPELEMTEDETYEEPEAEVGDEGEPEVEEDGEAELESEEESPEEYPAIPMGTVDIDTTNGKGMEKESVFLMEP